MRPRWLAMMLLGAALLRSQPLEPRPAPSDYPVQAKTANASLGAEYLVRSFGPRGRTLVVDDYLAVEIGFYPAAGQKPMLAAGHFRLRLNGKKQLLDAQDPAFVAASLKYPDWERRPTVVAGGGLGDVGVIIGQPRPAERFPGDPRPRQTRLPEPPRAPAPADRSGIEKETPETAAEVVLRTALPEGETSRPVSGFLFFAYKGKTKSIRSLELLYEGPAGSATLRLM